MNLNVLEEDKNYIISVLQDLNIDGDQIISIPRLITFLDLPCKIYTNGFKFQVKNLPIPAITVVFSIAGYPRVIPEPEVTRRLAKHRYSQLRIEPNPRIIHPKVARGFYSPISEETLAICQALDDLVESNVNLLVLSGSLLVLSALQNFSIKSHKVIHRLANKIYMLSNYVNQLILLWTPGHSKIVCNEQADNLARSVTESNVYIDWIASEDIHKNIYRNRIKKSMKHFTQANIWKNWEMFQPLISFQSGQRIEEKKS
ncbi:RNase H domain-containing protein [Trichonephila clavipes]|nr:RNase H domain-containing protein [Trichonephila clavipes]